MAGGVDKIRGFATNVANYQPLGSITSTDDPCHLKNQFNFAFDEVHYVNLLSQTFSSYGTLCSFWFLTKTKESTTRDFSLTLLEMECQMQDLIVPIGVILKVQD